MFSFFGPELFIIGELEKKIQGEETPELSKVSRKPRARQAEVLQCAASMP